MYDNSTWCISLLLLAIVDCDYGFLVVDVGCQGRISDGGFVLNSCLYPAFKNKVNLPKPRTLPTTTDNKEVDKWPSPEVRLVFAADDAFSLSNFCMKPYNIRNQTELQRIEFLVIAFREFVALPKMHLEFGGIA